MLSLNPFWPWLYRTRRLDPSDPAWQRRRTYIMRRDDWQCQIRRWRGIGPKCGKPAEHVDHIWPLYWGGSNDAANLRAACAACNLRKGRRVPSWQLWARGAYLAAWTVAVGVAMAYVAALAHPLPGAAAIVRAAVDAVGGR